MSIHDRENDPRKDRVYDLVRKVNEDSWIIHDGALITRHYSQPPQPYWEGDQGSFFTMTEAPSPRPPTQRISDDCPITDAVRMSNTHWGLYKIGQAHLKVTRNIGAQEHNTLKALADASFTFMVPTEYCHAVYGNDYYIVHSILPGKSIAEVWTEVDETGEHDGELMMKWTRQIADAYDQLSRWRNDRVCGIDGGNLNLGTCIKGDWDDPSSYNPEIIQKNFQDMRLDCSEFVFAHNQLMPFSFMIDETKGGLVGISMWSCAGFVPKDWVRTAMRSNGIDQSVIACWDNGWTEVHFTLWNFKMELALAEKGFRELWFSFGIWYTRDDDVKAKLIKLGQENGYY